MNRRSSTTTKVFVGSLPQGTSTEELRELFSPYGPVVECDVVNRCGFLHLENKSLAFKAIDELNNSTFKGNRISVEKGRVKPPSNRDGGRGSRNSFGGPMRGNRDNYRSGPYSRDGGDFERRGPQRPPMGGNNYGGGRGGYDNRQPPSNMMPPSRQMNDNYGNGLDRRPYDDRRGGYDDRFGRYMGPGGDDRMYSDNRNMYQDDRRPPMMNNRSVPTIDQRPGFDRKPYNDRNMMPDNRAAPGMNDRQPILGERRPLMDPQGPGGMGASPGGLHPPMQSSYDRRMLQDIYSRRDIPPKPMGGGGYNEPPRNAAYDAAYPPIQNRGYAGGPGPRRDLPPGRRY